MSDWTGQTIWYPGASHPRCEREAAWELGRSGRETGMEVASEVLQVGGIPGRRGRAAGMRSVALCHPDARQPRPGLASLLPDHRPRTHLPVQHRVTRLAPHCAMYPGCERSRDGGGTSVCLMYGTVRKQLVLLLCEQMRACVVHSCYSTTIAHMKEHGIPSPPRLDCACLCQTVLCSSWRSSGWETYCTACTANP